MTYISWWTYRTPQTIGVFDLNRPYPFTDRSAQHRFKSNTLMPSAELSVHIVACIYDFIFFHLWTHEELIKGALAPCWPSAHFVLEPPLVQRSQIMLHSVPSCHYFLFLVRLELFGPCCIHISFESHQSLFGSGPSLGPLVWCAPGFTLMQMNHTNRAIVRFNRTKHDKCEHTLKVQFQFWL